ncbi:MAG: hypothetical protein LJE94_14615 [Deltaproteobacteria bacterium]|nr:hypothetical protein [Deltaproteobacteria bacterium]
MKTIVHTTAIEERLWLSQKAFELMLTRPDNFIFSAGQRINILGDGISRDYSIASGISEPVIRLCIRHVPEGRMSAWLATCALGTELRIEGPSGYFQFNLSGRSVVCVSTGTGIAPFCAMARSGIAGFTLLHGVRQPEELYYQTTMAAAAGHYVACIPGGSQQMPACFDGRVTDYMRTRIEAGVYDFYLCGRGEMIRDATLLVDERFSGSRVFSEIFYPE